jgi:hypothetical protein
MPGSLNGGRPLPGGRVARLIDILAVISEEEEADEPALRG